MKVWQRMQSILGTQWHQLAGDEVAQRVGTDPRRGLDTFEVAHRQEQVGPNVLKAPKGQGRLVRFLLQFHQPLVYILLLSALATTAMKGTVDGAVILGVVLCNALIGFAQEAKALRAIQALARSMVSETTVIRAGEPRRLPAAELVPGDVVLLQAGERVPADLRLIRTRELHIDESTLTGESVPVHKNDRVLEPGTALAERINMVYSATMVTHGGGTGIVVATGDQTEIGRISELIASVRPLATPLTRKFARFSSLLMYAILGLAIFTFLIGLWRGEPWLEMFLSAVALAVAAIPEGLPAALTITMAIGVSRMARRHAIIRRLPAVETLGSTSVICSDKTGTLTQNQMTVREIAAGGESYLVSGIGYAPGGSIGARAGAADSNCNRALIECLTAGLLCNDTRMVEAGGAWRVEGDPTEGALIVAAAKAGLHPEILRSYLPRIDDIPFGSQHQYMATMHEAEKDKPRIAYLKGSSESILSRCTSVLGPDGNRRPLDKKLVQAQMEAMAAEGLRVLSFAKCELPADKRTLLPEDVKHGLIFLGMQGMIDPPRVEAAAAVAACRVAGVRVKMITGDHAGTALTIARQIGIVQAPDPIHSVLTGSAMAVLSDRELIAAVESTPVFARVSPEQKLRLVEALQARGHVVAMTGDGVNDAPALRQADIGVAMGIAGTEVAKEAADMVLTDDNFASIEAAIEEGRGVFDNLVKFITWTLPTNLGQSLVILAGVALGTAVPILPVQILWVNMTSAVLLGLPLAFEPKEADLMSRPPRNLNAPVLTKPLLRRIGLVGALLLLSAFGLYEWEVQSGASVVEARTVAVNAIVIGQLSYLFNCRSLSRSMFSLGVFSNRWLMLGVTAMIVAQLGFTYLPIMNELFHSAPISARSWGIMSALGMVIYGIMGMEKWLQNKVAERSFSGHPATRSSE